MSGLPDTVLAWRDTGRHVDIGGNSIFVVDVGAATETQAPPIVILHGFPGSSYDWCQVVPMLAARRRVVAFDFLGYGLSAKPREALYSLFEYSDLTEAVLAAANVDRCVLVSHDMGDTVAAELMQLQNVDKLSFTIDRAILTNGSIFIDLARLTRGQRLALVLPERPLPFGLPDWLLRRSLAESFTRDTPPPDGAIDAMVALIQREDGSRLIPRQIGYVHERRINQERWTQALVDFAGPLTAIWGERDPIAVLEMTKRLVELRPATEVVSWPDVGHWPSLEAPERLAEAILERV